MGNENKYNILYLFIYLFIYLTSTLKCDPIFNRKSQSKIHVPVYSTWYMT